MPSQSGSDVKLEIGHVLFIDIVGYSKLLIDDQREAQQQLNQITRDAPEFRAAEASGKLVRLPTGDGMALVFFTTPEAPMQCALEISEAPRQTSKIVVRKSHVVRSRCEVRNRARSLHRHRRLFQAAHSRAA